MLYKIKDLVTEKISGEWGNEGNPEIGVKVIRTANFTNEGKINFKNVVYRNIEQQKIKVKKLKFGDIIIEKSGGSPEQPVGRVVFFNLKTDESFLCNNFTTILRPNKKLVYPEYLFYQLYGNYKRRKTLKYQNKTTGIINLKLDDYLESKIDINIDINQQRKIPQILSEVEDLITQRKESIALLDELVKSTFLKMFGTINKPLFKTKSLEKLSLKITDGTHQSPKFIDEGIPFLFVSNIVNNKINYSTDRFISEKEYNELIKRTPIEVGDILYTTVGSYGNPAIVKSLKKFCFQRHIAYIKPNNEIINSIYLFGALKSEFVKRQVDKAVRGVAQKTLNLFELKKILIPIPPMELQNQFAQIVEEIEEMKTDYQKSLKELENLFGVLSQKAFKGELDLSKMEDIIPNRVEESQTKNTEIVTRSTSRNDSFSSQNSGQATVLKKDSGQARVTIEPEPRQDIPMKDVIPNEVWESKNLSQNKDNEIATMSTSRNDHVNESYPMDEKGRIIYPETDIRSKFHQSQPLKYDEDGIIDYSILDGKKFKYDNLSFEYLHGIIMQDQLKGRFSIKELLNILKYLGKDKLLTREELQEVITGFLENNPPFIEQIYDYPNSELKKKDINQREKQIMFQVTDAVKKS